MNSHPAATYCAQPAEDAAGMSKVAQRASDGRGDALDRGQPPLIHQLDGTHSAQLLHRMALSSGMPDLESFDVFLGAENFAVIPRIWGPN